jgi:hypothetical protein
MGATAITNARTASGTNVLHFASVPAGVMVGTPVYNTSDPDIVFNPSIPIYTYVTAFTWTSVTLNNKVNRTINTAEAIKLCVPTRTAGNVLTVQSVSQTIGIGATLQGTGVPTGDLSPQIFDQFPQGYLIPQGGLSPAQYSLDLRSGGSSLLLGRRAFTLKHGVAWGADALTTLAQMSPALGNNRNTGKPINKYAFQFVNCLQRLDMIFLECPGNQVVTSPFPTPNADLPAAIEGMQYDIVDGKKFGTVSDPALFGDQVEGTTTMPFFGPGAGQHIRIRYDGTVWRRCG